MADVEMVAFVRHPIAFQRAFRSWSGPVGTHLRGATELVAVAARIGAPKDTGELAAGHETDYTHHGADRDLESRVIAVPEHAKFVIGGTKPHVIRPKVPTGMLVFFWKKVGRVVHFPKVNHPRTTANNYLGKALERVMRRFT